MICLTNRCTRIAVKGQERHGRRNSVHFIHTKSLPNQCLVQVRIELSKIYEMPMSSIVPKLHDSILKSIEYTWEHQEVIFSGESYSEQGKEFSLEFRGVSLIEIPHENQWGPSASINEFTSTNDIYLIEMQSGDLIKVKALEMSYTTK